MGHVAIVTDTCACIPESLAQDLRLEVVPYFVHRGSETLRDMVDIRQEEFFRWLATAEDLPKTANPGPGDYLLAFRQASQHGADSLVTICMTSKGSGAYQAASVAREMAAQELPGLVIKLIDTLQVSMAHGWCAIEAARKAQEGASLDEVCAVANEVARKAFMVQTADTLRYLYMGGRIGKAQHLFGSILSIKPLISMKDGIIVPVGKERSRPKAYQTMATLIEQREGPGAQIKIAFMHAAAPEEARKVQAVVEPRFDCVEVLTTEFNPALGVHTGPGTVGLAYYPA